MYKREDYLEAVWAGDISLGNTIEYSANAKRKYEVVRRGNPLQGTELERHPNFKIASL